MTQENLALEPSFSDAITAVRATPDLSDQTRRHWCSSLAGIARAFDQPMEVIPARFSAVRARMAALHHVPLVLTERLVEAGLILIREAEMYGKTALARAKGVRNGLLVALLALHPIRVKNFAALTIGDTFINVDGRWWIRIPSDETKSNRADERQVPEFITDAINRYIDSHRPVLCSADTGHLELWVSSTTGRQLTTKNLGTLISKLTRETIGVDVSPHLFRTAGASTAAIYGGKHPHLASALLNHRDPRINEEHYNRAMGLSAGEEYADITESYRQHDSGN
jgi:integrase